MKESVTKQLQFYVNGQQICDEAVDPELTLADYLRDKLRLTGTKLGCEEGSCGSCTVVIAENAQPRPLYRAVNACLVPIWHAHGRAVTTVEGVGSVDGGLHPIQRELVERHGSQCGFCTAGFVMSLFALLRNSPQPTRTQLQRAIAGTPSSAPLARQPTTLAAGNFCRCTGYRPILEAAYSFERRADTTENDFEQQSCRDRGGRCPCGKREAGSCASLETRADTERAQMSFTRADVSNGTRADVIHLPGVDKTQDLLFPAGLKLSNSATKSLHLTGERVDLFSPATLDELLQLRAAHANALLVAGGTVSCAVERSKADARGVWIDTTRVGQLRQITTSDDALVVGSAVTLAELEHVLTERASDDRPVAAALAHSLDALSVQLRNLATWAGSVASGSSVSDIAVPFLALGVQVQVAGVDGRQRWLTIDKDFFVGKPNRTRLQPTDTILAARINDRVQKGTKFRTFRQSLKSGVDSALASAAFWIVVGPDDVVSEARLAFGGLTDRPVLALHTAKLLLGRRCDDETMEMALQSLAENELKLFGGSNDRRHYRSTLFLSFLYQFFVGIHDDNSTAQPYGLSDFDQADSFVGTQVATPASESNYVGRPLTHAWAERHATGVAKFCADEQVADLLHMALVLSTHAHANISVDPSEALRAAGVVTYVGVDDIPAGGTNKPGPLAWYTYIDDDSLAFADGKVTACGQVIGAVVATDVRSARRAARLVRVRYHDLPALLSPEAAFAAGSFVGATQRAARGDVEAALRSSDVVLEGEARVGRQEHAYMETQAATVVPGEDGELDVTVASQAIGILHGLVARLTATPAHKINLRAKRLGGGFGGKVFGCNKSLLPAAVAAVKLGRPVRCSMSRREDFESTGTKHPAKARYKVGFTKEGRLLALDVDVLLDAGNFLDCSVRVANALSSCVEHVFAWSAVRAAVHSCRTNLLSSTAFRGFGRAQAFFLTESIAQRVADYLQVDALKFRQMNFSDRGYVRVGGDVLVDENLHRCWQQCIDVSRFEEQREAVVEFNQTNQWRKRGIAIIPTRYPIGYGGFMEQGGALVHIYLDGTVRISHGGIEMGQGLNTKCEQIAATVLRIERRLVNVVEAATDKLPNSVTTSASQGTDVYGLAVKRACEQLVEALQPYRTEQRSWPEAVLAAFLDNVSLCACIVTDVRKGQAMAPGPRYMVSGAACAVVEIDALSGAHRVLSVDVVMDAGNSVNAAIDLGQIEGGFCQGYGWLTTEEFLFDERGRLLTNSFGKYKAPGVACVPRRLRVRLLDDCASATNVYSSRGVGEPPVFLGASVYFALREAVKAARVDNGCMEAPADEAPLTAEKIRLLCNDRLTKMACVAHQ